MGNDISNLLMTLLMIGGGITAFILAIIFIAVPLFRGIGAGIGGGFRLIGWTFMHIFEFIGGMLKDTIRFIGALIAMIVLLPFVPLNIVIGRWSAAGHFAESVKRECKVGSACVYRVVIRRPLKFLLLDGLLEGLEQRVPEAVVDAPTSDKPGRRTGQFDGYTILGSLRSGGSGAKLYVAEPSKDVLRKHKGMPERVVIKSFALTEGSSLPQIVRESRALECAKQMGLVLDHGMDNHRFFYIMPYHAGDHLGAVTRQLHGESDGRGLNQRQLNLVMGYLHDLLGTLSQYHNGGLWHKDVKPENVIVHDGRAHVVDLGLVTPLRSAMTLTTHGTEYFRDPEMVRQALRGVKVHQVNGAKFDIYAAGAVLYFMIENTFPAHGGLSRFVNNSPEALRWIVRRAMTEYNQRYETAHAMLADLDYVASARDAFAVKPAELPSMHGAASPEAPAVMMVNATGMNDVDAVEALRAGHARAHAFAVPAGAAGVQGFGLAGGIGAAGPFMQVGKLNLDANGNPLPREAGAFQRAKLKVKNWWTGAYEVEDMPSGLAPAGVVGAGASSHDGARNFRAQAASFRSQAEQIAGQARIGAISARKAAREQIKAARERARDIRSRASAHRQRVASHSAESGWAVTIGVLSVLFLAAMITLGVFFSSSRSSRSASAGNSVSANNGQPIVVAVDCTGPLSEATRKSIDKIIRRYKDQGYDVITDAPETASIIPALQKWRKYDDQDSDNTIEAFMARNNAYAIVHVPVTTSKKSGKQTIQDSMLIHSTEKGASTRRRPGWMLGELPPTPVLPYLLINDHPAKADPQVETKVQDWIKAYQARGWTVKVDDDAEVAVRKALPSGPIDPRIALPEIVYRMLIEHGYAGIVRIEAGKGDAPPQERMAMTRIDGHQMLPQAGTMNDAMLISPNSPAPPAEPVAASSTKSDSF